MLMYLHLYFPAVLSQGGLARCLLMCISRRLDDQRVIGAVGEGTEVHGRSRKNPDYQPALATRYCTGKIHIKNTKPFSKTHNRVILIYLQLCMSARRRECMEKRRKKQCVIDDKSFGPDGRGLGQNRNHIIKRS